MPTPFGSAAALAALLLVVPSLVSSEVIIVNKIKDTPGQLTGCPGPECNLRSALAYARWNDTISLYVSPVMDEFILDLPKPLPGRNGTLTIKAALSSVKQPPFSITPSRPGVGFLRTQTWPWSTATGFLTLEVKGIEFSGFTWTADGTTGLQAQGILFCLGVGLSYDTCNNVTGSAGQGPAYAPQGYLRNSLLEGGALPAPRTRSHRDSAPDLSAAGPAPTPILRITDCVFALNTLNLKGDNNGPPSLIAVSCTTLEAGVNCPFEILGSRFIGNQATGDEGIGLIIDTVAYLNTPGATTPLRVVDSQFLANHINSANPGDFTIAGGIITNSGDTWIQDCTFSENTLGSTRAVVQTNDIPPNYNYHVTVIGSSFTNNVANTKLPPSTLAEPATVRGSWVVLSAAVIDIPSNCPPVATSSPNDQYLVDTSIGGSSASPIQLSGFQIFNRNPVLINLANGTLSQLGFATCEEAKDWLPCPVGTTCKDIPLNGINIGYFCRG